MNNRIENIFDLKESEVKGKPYKSVFDSEVMSGHLGEMLHSEPQRNQSLELMLPGVKGRQEKILHVNSTRIVEEESGSSLIISVFRDVTVERRMQNMRAEMLSSISHELRTPLTSIRGFSELIANDNLSPEEIREFSGIVYTEACRLSVLITKFLELSKIELGEIPVKKSTMNMVTLMSSTVSNFRKEAGRKRIKLTEEYDRDELAMNLDGEKIEKAISEIIDNAIQFSPESSEVNIRLMVESKKVFIEIRDAGCGISQNERSDIFKKFFKSGKNQHRERKGNGLGLSIAKTIVEKHGGIISVQSRLGHGSSFKIALPI